HRPECFPEHGDPRIFTFPALCGGLVPHLRPSRYVAPRHHELPHPPVVVILTFERFTVRKLHAERVAYPFLLDRFVLLAAEQQQGLPVTRGGVQDELAFCVPT